MVENGLLVFQFLLFSLTLFLELGLGVTAIDSLHLSVLVDDQEDGRVRVHEADLAQLNFELPELDQVLGSRELKEQKTVLFGAQAFVGGAHLDEELVFQSGVRFDARHRVELEAPFKLGIDAFHAPDLHLTFL